MKYSQLDRLRFSNTSVSESPNLIDALHAVRNAADDTALLIE